jgi:multiple sugar transport system ATP-binding protein
VTTLTIENLRKSYGAVETLRGIDLALEDGEFLVLLGPSGCGKSTILNIIAGLIEPSAGDVRIGARSVLGVHPKDRDIAMVFQSYALYPNLSVARNIGFGLEMRRVPKAERAAAVARVAETLQITALLDRRPAALSGGQRQRVAIGRALVRDPAVFLFDEPLSNLDAKLRLETRAEIKRLHQALGKTMVYVTHDQIEAMTLATRIAVLRDGRIEQIGTPEEVYRRPATLFVAGFVGSPGMNLIPGRLGPSGLAPDDVGGWIADAARLRDLVSPDLSLPAEAMAVVLGVRPESLRLGPPDAPGIAAGVEIVELTGPEKIVTCRTDGGVTLLASVSPERTLRPGERVSVGIAPGSASLFDAASGRRID